MLASRRPAQLANPRFTGMVQDDGAPGSRARLARMPNGAGSPNLLASFAGKNRVLVISAPHESDGYYRLMMSLLKPDVYCELAERHVQQIVMFHQEGEMGGKVRRITSEGKVVEEPLDTALIPRLMNFLKLEKGKFGMVLLRKTLQVEERYPYPVRLEAMYEVIDQAPMRKLEKTRQRGFVQKCKGAGVEGQVVEGDGTSIIGSDAQIDTPASRKPILRKPFRRPVQTTTALTTTTTTPSEHYTKAYPSRYGDNRTDRKDYNRKQAVITPTQHKPAKPKPPKKKNGGKVLTNEYEDKYHLGRRRLILITTPREENNMYVQQRDEYLEHVCEMAIRKISIVTIFGTVSNNTMKIDHYQLEHDKPMKGMRQEDLVNKDLIYQIRKEFGMMYEDFYMVLTDFDMKVKQFYEVPISMKAVFDYVDTFSSRIKEMEQQKRDRVLCKKEDKPRSLENFLSRFRWSS
ncbi:hypothetical protein AGOR_G00063810 [Albula goreensis]|uniref:Coiled-coil domain-containing protein 80 n=1 Tax=Albula goreensis TaxID=1534307 RepID=A0A8T3DZ91_9TELE|nr:hypothetical protein AGOR_G00063810 [Albula goreensis]